MQSLDLTEIIVALLALVGTVLVAWLPLRWGKSAAKAAKADIPPAEHPRTVEFREHERTRDLIRDQTGEMRSRFQQVETLVLGVMRPGGPPDRDDPR